MKRIAERRAELRMLASEARAGLIAITIGCCAVPYGALAQDDERRSPAAGPAAAQEQRTCRDEARPDPSCTGSGQRLYKVCHQDGRRILNQPGRCVGQGGGLHQSP
jgi:hypothetical protein